MKNERTCKIVQDLLPNYIEKLTNEETNKYIEEHLENCEECKKVLENMKKDLELNGEKADKKEVKYLKKFNNKMKILEAILIVIVLIVIAVIGRKAIIITSLYNKAKQYENSTNFHETIYTYSKDNYIKTETYKLDNRVAFIQTRIINGEKEIQRIYGYETSNENHSAVANGKTNEYIENKNWKKAGLNTNMAITANIPNEFFYSYNLSGLLYLSIFTDIKTKEYNGVEYYYITGLNTNWLELEGGLCINKEEGIYINKQTGLVERVMSSTFATGKGQEGFEGTLDKTYEFGTVTEDDFIEPDISEYEIVDEIWKY